MCLNKKRVSDLYRTATTAYPCSIPRLGEFCGSWSYKTYPTAKVQNFFFSTKNVGLFVGQFVVCVLSCHRKRSVAICLCFTVSKFLVLL